MIVVKKLKFELVFLHENFNQILRTFYSYFSISIIANNKMYFFNSQEDVTLAKIWKNMAALVAWNFVVNKELVLIFFNIHHRRKNNDASVGIPVQILVNALHIFKLISPDNVMDQGVLIAPDMGANIVPTCVERNWLQVASFR